MIIGVDLDDVLFNLCDSLQDWHNERFDTNFKKKDINTYFVEEVWGCTQDDVRVMIAEFYNHESHFQTLPMAGAIEAIERLSKEHTLFVVTARPKKFEESTLKWINKHFPNMFQEVCFSDNPTHDLSKQKKSDICKQLGIEVFIDDAIHNAEDIADAGIPVLLLDMPWNRTEVEHPITRVHSWEEIVEKLSQ